MPEKTAFARMKLVRCNDMPPPPATPSPYVELGVTSPFSFLRGASDAIELVLTALSQGMHAIGMARLRDYYRVEDSEGRRYWIYREGLIGDGRGGLPNWYIHGLFG